MALVPLKNNSCFSSTTQLGKVASDDQTHSVTGSLQSVSPEKEKNKTKAVRVSQHPETMIFKSQLKTTRSRPLLCPHSSFPSTKPLLELVQGIIKIQSEAKSTALPPGISANQQRGKKDRNHRKSVFSKVQTPPPGEMKFGTDEGRMKEANKEKGDRMSTFPVEAAVAT